MNFFEKHVKQTYYWDLVNILILDASFLSEEFYYILHYQQDIQPSMHMLQEFLSGAKGQ